MRAIVNELPHDLQPLAEPERSSRLPRIAAPRQKQSALWRQIRESLVLVISLAILGKSSDYHMEGFSAGEKYWNEVVAGRQSSPQATASLAAGIPGQK